jgi:hypothetical protein
VEEESDLSVEVEEVIPPRKALSVVASAGPLSLAPVLPLGREPSGASAAAPVLPPPTTAAEMPPAAAAPTVMFPVAVAIGGATPDMPPLEKPQLSGRAAAASVRL